MESMRVPSRSKSNAMRDIQESYWLRAGKSGGHVRGSSVSVVWNRSVYLRDLINRGRPISRMAITLKVPEATIELVVLAEAGVVPVRTG